MKLKSKECIFMAKHGLNSKMRIRPNWSLILGIFGGSYVKGEEEEEAKKGLDTCLDFLWFCLNLLWVLYGF